MSFCFSNLPYTDTRAFSRLVTDYLAGDEKLRPFYQYGTDYPALLHALENRKQHPVNREVLTTVLREQYKDLQAMSPVVANINSLEKPDTFTICTAHQPNLLTGYLYFVYKIIHAIRLASDLKQVFPEYHFVPVYYMGSEDNDLKELGTFRYNDRSFVWDAAGQAGAVGRMKTESLQPLLEELFCQLGPPGEYCTALQQLLEEAYLHHDNMAAATRYLVHTLFGRYGLVVLDPDDALLKKQFIPIMRDELLQHTSQGIVREQVAALSENYKVQAYPREINIFYLNDNLRERIEQTPEGWAVVNTNIRWTEQTLLEELEQYPERFSPNVILRALFQETILPNIAFIGGGAEVAYWMQLKTLFAYYNVFFPSLQLRQSVLWIEGKEYQTRMKLGLSVTDLFRSEEALTRLLLEKEGSGHWRTTTEMQAMEQIMAQLRQKATDLDPTLTASASAALAKISYQVQVLEKKMLRAEKRKIRQQLATMSGLKGRLFPENSLQERTENFISYYLQYGPAFFDILYDSFQPEGHDFLIVEVCDV